MKNTHFGALLIICIFPLFIQAQTTLYNPQTESTDFKINYKEVHEKLKQLYIKKLDSESHIRAAVLSKDFVKKMNHPDKGREQNYLKNPLNWIQHNLDKTGFSSYEEAEIAWKNLQEEWNNETVENQAYYSFLNEARGIYGPQLFNDVYMAVFNDHPEKFKIPNSFPRKPK